MSAAAKMLERARAADVWLEARGRRLAYDAPANVSPDLLAQLRECKVELLELLQHERRALLDLATDPKAKTRWLSSLIGTLSPSRVPHHWPAATWPQFIADAQTCCRDWGERAFISGWAAWELFGCHCRAPWGRIQGIGLVLLLRGHEIAALTATEAVIRTPTGACQTFRRKPSDPLHPAERRLCGSSRLSMEFTAQDSDTLTAKYPRWTNAMNTDQLLEHAAGVVKRRRREYGEPADLFEHVAARWSLTLGTKISPAQVVVCLIDLSSLGSPTIQGTSTARSTSQATQRCCGR